MPASKPAARSFAGAEKPRIGGQRTHRRRPAEAVAEEMAALDRAGAGYAFIVDSVFNSSPPPVIGICKALLRRGTRLKWCCFLQPQRLTADLMRLMAERLRARGVAGPLWSYLALRQRLGGACVPRRVMSRDTSDWPGGDATADPDRQPIPVFRD